MSGAELCLRCESAPAEPGEDCCVPCDLRAQAFAAEEAGDDLRAEQLRETARMIVETSDAAAARRPDPARPYSTARSGVDRRQGPRREAERNLHYAEVSLLAAAIAAADFLTLAEDAVADDSPLAALCAAAHVYGVAVAEAGR